MAEETKGSDGGGEKTEGAGDHRAGAGKGETKVTSDVPEKAVGQLNPSAPGNTATTPGTNTKVG